jgi:uncharacterized protein YutE (UPF0331/DUF86 family)
MEVDKGKIKHRFSDINESLKEIQQLTSLEDKKFWSDKKNIAALKYYLLQAIEGIGSICAHIAAKEFSKGISAFGECFDLLEEKGALDANLTSRLRKMVNFRNKPIHQYWEIDDKKVLEYAREDIDDFNDFIKAINKVFLT